jgi:FimV-like protein
VHRGLALILSCLFALPIAAQAQTTGELEAARRAFQEGVRLSSQERWQDAAERFRYAMSIRPAPAVKYNLAFCLAESGDVAEAAELLRSVLEDPSFAQAEEARQLLQSVEPRIARISVTVRGDPPRASVTLDGSPLERERLGTPIEVDPGPHVVDLRRRGEVVASGRISLSEGETRDIELVDPLHESETVEEVPIEETHSDGDPAVYETWWFWTLLGAVVVGGVVAVGFLATPGEPDPVNGNLSPGVLRVEL